VLDPLPPGTHAEVIRMLNGHAANAWFVECKRQSI
jgi:hypothetical protein